eukprot:5051253-Pyramimonas_sp.AAC.1
MDSAALSFMLSCDCLPICPGVRSFSCWSSGTPLVLQKQSMSAFRFFTQASRLLSSVPHTLELIAIQRTADT